MENGGKPHKSSKNQTRQIEAPWFQIAIRRRALQIPPEQHHSNKTQHEICTRVATTCHDTANNVLRVKQKSKHGITSEKIMDLSIAQEKVRDKAKSFKDKTKILKLKKRRNKNIKELKQEIKAENDKMLDIELEEIQKFNGWLKQMLSSYQKDQQS